MNTLTQILSSLIIACVSLLSVPILSADSNVTSTTFTINVASLDPLGSSHSSSSSSGGIGAFTALLGNITDTLLFIIPIFAAVSFLIAGYFYIFSAGDSEKAGRAKTIIKWNILAILIAFLSFGIVKIVASFFNT